MEDLIHDLEISVHISLEAQDLLFSGWACKMSENFNGKGPDFKEMDDGKGPDFNEMDV
jgi:hypothetical protein